MRTSRQRVTVLNALSSIAWFWRGEILLVTLSRFGGTAGSGGAASPACSSSWSVARLMRLPASSTCVLGGPQRSQHEGPQRAGSPQLHASFRADAAIGPGHRAAACSSSTPGAGPPASSSIGKPAPPGTEETSSSSVVPEATSHCITQVRIAWWGRDACGR